MLTSFYLIAGVLLLYIGAEALVRGSAALALRLGVTPLVIGLTVVSFGTSSPELLVSFRAAMAHDSAISLGNVIGSNIANIALVLGLAALIKPLRVERQVIRREMPIMLFASLLVAAMLWNDRLDRWEGALLFACLLAYTFFSIRSSRRETHMATGVRPGHATAWSITLVTGGLLMLAAGAHWFVLGAVHVALHFGLSMFVVGLTVVAIGTSLPEIATSVVAGIKGEGDIAVGNAVGSNIFNLFCILGLTALFFEIDGSGLSGVDLAAMVVLALAALPIMRNGFAIRRWEGALLLVAYVGYLAYLLQRS